MGKIATSLIDLIGRTPLLELSGTEAELKLKARVVAKLEYFNPARSVKDRAALAMIERAERKGLISEGTTIIEPTSGNTGIGLALIAAIRGYKLILTMPDAMSVERRTLLEALGAKLVLTPAYEGMGGAIRVARELAEEIGNAYIPQQFENPANPEIHRRTTAEEIISDTDGEVDIFDVTRVVNIILGVDAEAKARGTVGTQNGTVLAATGGNGMELSVDKAGRYTAMQFDVAVPEGCTLQEVALNSSSDHVLAYARTGENLYTVVAYSMRNAGFEPTEDALVRLTFSDGGRGRLVNGRLVTTDGLYVLMDMADEATGIASLKCDGQEGAIYSLTGQRMGTDAKRIPAGVYIINNKKVLVK